MTDTNPSRAAILAFAGLSASPLIAIAQDAGAAPAGAEPTIAGQGEGTVPAQGAPGGQPPAGAPGFGLFLPMILLFFVVMMVMTSMGQRKERKKQAALLSSIKRNDLVQTVGGIIGTVSEVSDKEILVKVDDQTGARIRFAKSSVQTVLSSRGSAGSGSSSGSGAQHIEHEPVEDLEPARS